MTSAAETVTGWFQAGNHGWSLRGRWFLKVYCQWLADFNFQHCLHPVLVPAGACSGTCTQHVRLCAPIVWCDRVLCRHWAVSYQYLRLSVCSCLHQKSLFVSPSIDAQMYLCTVSQRAHKNIMHHIAEFILSMLKRDVTVYSSHLLPGLVLICMLPGKNNTHPHDPHHPHPLRGVCGKSLLNFIWILSYRSQSGFYSAIFQSLFTKNFHQRPGVQPVLAWRWIS